MIINPSIIKYMPIKNKVYKGKLNKPYGEIYLIRINNPKSQFHNKLYIGQHKGDIFEDNYWGSGIKIIKYRKKYHIYGLERYIIAYANSKKELNELEAQYITIDVVLNENFLNNKIGGDVMCSLKGYIVYNNGIKEIKLKPTDPIPDGFIKGSLHSSSKGCISYNNGIKEIRLKPTDPIPDGFIKGGLCSPTKGYIAYNNGIKEIKLKPTDPIPDGFIKGKLYTPTKGSIIYNNRIKEIRLKPTDPIPDGFIKGRLCKKNIYYNNGIKEICIKPTDPIPDGFVRGRLKRK